MLELACGSGRFTVPLAKERVNITGIDISKDMLELAKFKASKDELNIRFLHGDMRSLDLGEKFKLIMITAQSLSHLGTREDVEKCFSCVHQHSAAEGRFLIELFNSSVTMFSRESGRRHPVGQFEYPKAGPQVFVTVEVRYDAVS